MRLTKRFEQMVGMLVACAAQDDRVLSLQSLAERVGTTRQNAAQVASALVRAGYMNGLRGRGGGMTLAMAPGAVTLGDILELSEGPGQQAVRAEGHRARLDRALLDARNQYVERLRRTTIADLAFSQADGRETRTAAPVSRAAPTPASTPAMPADESAQGREPAARALKRLEPRRRVRRLRSRVRGTRHDVYES